MSLGKEADFRIEKDWLIKSYKEKIYDADNVNKIFNASALN